MSSEKPDFNTESTKTGQESLTANVLQEQARLPKDQWNEKFRQLIEEKSRQNKRDGVEEIEESLEVLRERTFKRCMDGLGLSEDMVRGKKILDLGCAEGEFVKSLVEKGITLEAYGVDVQEDESADKDTFKSHFFQGNFEEDLPVQNADYVVSVGAVSSSILGGEEAMDIRRIVEKSLASLKEGGEIRIYPIQEAAKATPLEGLQASQEKWKALLEEISETQNVECRIEPRNINVAGYDDDIILESVLIIKRKS